MKKIILFIFPFIFLNCVSYYYVDVNSLGNDKGIEKTYIILPSTNVADNKLMFNEVKGYIVKMLSSKGYKLVDDYKIANLVLLVNYGIGEPQRITSTYSMPIFGQTGVSSSTTIGSSTYYRPSYGITGSTTSTSTRIEYRRHLDIIAFDNQAFINNNKEVQLWHTSAVSSGSSKDLREVIPFMVAAIKGYVGTDTRKIIETRIPENDITKIEVKK